MCRGYSEDLENFTELAWSDDKDLDFRDKTFTENIEPTANEDDTVSIDKDDIKDTYECRIFDAFGI